MSINSSDFFQEAVLRICSDLDIGKALHSCMLYIKGFLPVDAMYLQLFEKEFNAMRIIVKATENKAENLDLLVAMPGELKRLSIKGHKRVATETPKQLWIVNDSTKEPIANSLATSMKEPASSILGMLLLVNGQPVGSLVCLAHGTDRYTQDHLDLMSLLKKPFYIALSNTLAHRRVKELRDLLIDDNRFLQQELMHISGDNIIGSNFGLKHVMELVQQVSQMDSPVLLLGETGTGKDVIANAIHNSSLRSNNPFISVNCGAIPESLIDSELFGHEKGAFTGALKEKRGRFERANTGTIFLDEIGELPLPAQVRLLRVLQNKECERVGGTRQIKLDIRIIAATNKELSKMIKENSFREDLFFRLNVFPIKLPPLRERIADIPALVQHFIVKKSRDLKLGDFPALEDGSIDILCDYDWPGNVRELENIVERALILSNGKKVDFRQVLSSRDVSRIPSKTQEFKPMKLEAHIRSHIENTITYVNGKIHGPGGAAELLGINANTLRNRMDKLGINYKK